jgi:hypothetical protein
VGGGGGGGGGGGRWEAVEEVAEEVGGGRRWRGWRRRWEVGGGGRRWRRRWEVGGGGGGGGGGGRWEAVGGGGGGGGRWEACMRWPKTNSPSRRRDRRKTITGCCRKAGMGQGQAQSQGQGQGQSQGRANNRVRAWARARATPVGRPCRQSRRSRPRYDRGRPAAARAWRAQAGTFTRGGAEVSLAVSCEWICEQS